MARVLVPLSSHRERHGRRRVVSALELVALLGGTALIFGIVAASLFIGAVIAISH